MTIETTAAIQATVTTLGFPRIGSKRELKTALEGYWGDVLSADALQQRAQALRLRHWQLQRDAGADVVPCNDFSLYDHVLDTAWLVDAIPAQMCIRDSGSGEHRGAS